MCVGVACPGVQIVNRAAIVVMYSIKDKLKRINKYFTSSRGCLFSFLCLSPPVALVISLRAVQWKQSSQNPRLRCHLGVRARPPLLLGREDLGQLLPLQMLIDVVVALEVPILALLRKRL